MAAQSAQGLLAGMVPRSAEPAFDFGEQKPFKFCLYVAPFVPPTERYVNYMGTYMRAQQEQQKSASAPVYQQTRTLVVHGAKDPIVSQAMCRDFAAYSMAEAVVSHEGGHVIPVKDEWPAKMAAWLEAAAMSEMGISTQQQVTARL